MEVMEMLEAEQELGMMESKNKVETKRKSNVDGKPPPKRKKLDNLEDWGMLEDVEEDNLDIPEENPETAQIRKWLVKTTPKQDITNFGVGKSSANDNPNIKLKQMELDFVSLVSRMMTNPASPTTATPVVGETAQQ